MAVRRGNRYYVKNSTTTGVADYDVLFGDPSDQVLVGDWGRPAVLGDDPTTPAIETDYMRQQPRDGDLSDQLAVRRGNQYFLSDEMPPPNAGFHGYQLRTERTFAFGEPTDRRSQHGRGACSTALPVLLERAVRRRDQLSAVTGAKVANGSEIRIVTSTRPARHGP